MDKNKEIRYIKIESCTNCEHVGHSINNNNPICINFCVHPNNSDAYAIDSFMYQGIYYPVTSKTKSFADCPIPVWCKLPKPKNED